VESKEPAIPRAKGKGPANRSLKEVGDHLDQLSASSIILGPKRLRVGACGVAGHLR